MLFASEYGRRDFSLPGVKRVLLKKPKDRKKATALTSTSALDAGERDWSMSYLRGRATASSLMGVLAEGFEPDMVILSGSMGNGLFVRNLFPEAFLVAMPTGISGKRPRPGIPSARCLTSPWPPAISAMHCKQKTFLIVTAFLRRRNGNGSNTPNGCGAYFRTAEVCGHGVFRPAPPAGFVSETAN